VTTYTTITNGEVDQDSPVTQPLMEALRDNPLAIAEGDTTAPKVQAGAINNPSAVASRASPSSLPGVLFTITDLDRVASIFVVSSAIARNISGGGGPVTTTTRYRLSNDNGATWGSYTTLSTITTESSTSVERQDFNLLDITSSNAIELSATGDATGNDYLSAAIAFCVNSVSP